MDKSKISLITTFAVGACLVIVPALPAAASSWPCDAVGATVSANLGRLVGTGTWSCGMTQSSSTYGAEVDLYHNYDLLPDAFVFYGYWYIPFIYGTQSRSTQRCDQGTVAQYYAVASIPPWSGSGVATSGIRKIATCMGTGS
jgi:hypothetical protein